MCAARAAPWPPCVRRPAGPRRGRASRRAVRRSYRTPARPIRATRERRYRRAARASATRATSRSHVAAVVDRGTGTERPRRRPGRAFVELTRLDSLAGTFRAGHGAVLHANFHAHMRSGSTRNDGFRRVHGTRAVVTRVTTRTSTHRHRTTAPHRSPHTAIPHRHGRTHVHPQDDSDTRILDVLCYAMYYDGRGGSFGLPELGSRRSRLAARAACALAAGRVRAVPTGLGSPEDVSMPDHNSP